MVNATLTFGVEIEALRLTDEALTIMQRRGFRRHYDGSIRGRNGERLPHTIEEGGGSEVITPILTVRVSADDEGKHIVLDYGDTAEIIKDMCDCIAEVNTSCGVHVHIGRPTERDPNKSVWKPEHVRSWLAVCTMREDKFYTLCPPSRRNNPHSMPIKSRFSDSDLTSFYPVGEVLPRKDENPKRYCWLNLIETKRRGNDPLPHRMGSEATGTVEIRMLGNTRRFSYIWSWIQLWMKVAAYIAYFNPTFSFMHTVVTDSISTELENVNREKNNGDAAEASTIIYNNAPRPDRANEPTLRRATRPRSTLRRPRLPNDMVNP